MDKKQLKDERKELLYQINDLFDLPLTLLSLLWLVLIIVDFVYGLSSSLQKLSLVIWGIFIVDFLIELYISPLKKDYLKSNWLVTFSLFLPALRVLRLFKGFRLVRFANSVRSLNLARILSSFNRSLRTVRQVIRQRGLRYVLLLTVLITFLGAAGMYNFEHPGITSYWDALWWTAMIMTTIGSAYWPVTPEGRILAFSLSVYAFSIFGYITAALASMLVGKDKEELSSKEIAEMRSEVQKLSSEINRLLGKEKK
ncbi:potassium channel family protein [Methanosarcina flavescens]|jgi:voltage-gated potassium channel|uniref:Ion transporter n=1 Tax=Methanosarcina flavescens TaxID=1715806 RepID=A0A660HRB7_9EURY|nr:ion transporter [Methanosarcina flavescens]AYK14808.1 ion transporter [Methanosarcina flavescens]